MADSTVSGVPPVVLPTRMAGKARSATPSSSIARGQPLTQDALNPANTSIGSQRFERTAAALMRTLAESNGLASTALINLMAMAESGWSVMAYDTWTQEFSRPGLLAAETVIAALDTAWDYSKGYNGRRSLASLMETALWEIPQTGGIGIELVLDKTRLPLDLVLFPYDQVIWKSDGKGGVFPAQKPPAGQEVELNYPTVFVAESVKSADRRYTLPFVASGAQRLIHYESFVEDMWRILRRAGEPRIVIKLDYEKVVASASMEIREDDGKLAAYLDQVRSDIEGLLNDLQPEDALVTYDLAEVSQIDSAGEKKDFQALLSELSGQAASAVKSNASMLGMRAGGSQNVASTEAMLSTKVASLLQTPVEEVFSKALTLAVRLYGIDAYVRLRFHPINLRPEDELEAHKSMKQARVLELLSNGRITDDEAQAMLGLRSLPAGAQELTGTGFYDAKPADTMPASGTNARNANIAPTETPTSGGGSDNAQRA